MNLRITIIVGNPTPASRTRKVAETLARNIVGLEASDLNVVELSDHSTELFLEESDRLAQVMTRVVESHLVFFATPTYKASYTGLLKAFLDRFKTNGLQGVVAIPIATGATNGHSMSATHVLAPLLAELGAIVPGRGFYLPMTDFGELESLASLAAHEYISNFEKISALQGDTMDGQ